MHGQDILSAQISRLITWYLFNKFSGQGYYTREMVTGQAVLSSETKPVILGQSFDKKLSALDNINYPKPNYG
jgi:hypothetical protein